MNNYFKTLTLVSFAAIATFSNATSATAQGILPPPPIDKFQTVCSVLFDMECSSLVLDSESCADMDCTRRPSSVTTINGDEYIYECKKPEGSDISVEDVKEDTTVPTTFPADLGQTGRHSWQLGDEITCSTRRLCNCGKFLFDQPGKKCGEKVDGETEISVQVFHAHEPDEDDDTTCLGFGL